MNVDEQAARAALRILDRTLAASYLTALSVEALGAEMASASGESPVLVLLEQQFSTAGSFDPTKVLSAAVMYVSMEILEVARSNADDYRLAAEMIARGGGPETVAAALAADLRDYQPWDIDDHDNARESVYYLAIALSVLSPRSARLLATLHEAGKEVYRSAYDAFLAVFQRRLATGVSYDQLYLAVSGYLEGMQLYRRYGVEIDDEHILNSVIRIFLSHTTSVDGAEQDPIVDLWSSIDPQWRQ